MIYFNFQGVYPYADTYVENESQSQEKIKEDEQENLVVGELENDIDVVDVDSGVTNKEGDEEVYEYYYVYYDEDGNIVNKNQTPAAAPAIKDKVQEIPLSSVELVKQTNENVIPSSNDEKPGDTPTIYAQIQNLESQEDSQKGAETEKEEEGLSIFGIPIPKIPLPILSFGLTPAFSHGLLPIGRKGDPSSTEDDVIRTKKRPVNTRYKQKPQSIPEQLIPDLTRGPDSILDPIWVEGLEKAASAAVGSRTYFDKDSANSNIEDRLKEKASANAGVHQTLHHQRPFRNPQTSKGQSKAYGYLRPQNPIIPLNNVNFGGIQYTAPKRNGNNGNIPAIKFDHPLPSIQSISIQSQSDTLPISLSPSLKRQTAFLSPHNEKKYVYHDKNGNVNGVYQGGGIKVTDRYQSEAGFVPIFNPDVGDPVYMKQGQKQNDIKQSAFPGIEATLRNEPLESQNALQNEMGPVQHKFSNIKGGKNVSSYGLTYPQQPKKEFALSGGIPLNVPYSSSGQFGSNEQFPKQQYYEPHHHAIPIPLVLRPTKIPPRLTTPPPVVWGQSSFDLDDMEEDKLNDYVYDEFVDDNKDRNKFLERENFGINLNSLRENSRSTTIKQVIEEINVPSSTTERQVPTLSVEEVLPTEYSSESSTVIKSDPIEIINNDLEDTSTEREHRTGLSLLPNEIQPLDVAKDGEGESGGDYEYEYYYEYYEDDNSNTTSNKDDYKEEIGDQEAQPSEISEQVSNEDVVSLQNILNLIDGKTKTTHQVASTVHSLMLEDIKEREMSMLKEKISGEQQMNKPPMAPPKFRATLPPPIRTSTFLPYESNYLDNRRSTVTVDYNRQNSGTNDDIYNVREERDGQASRGKTEGDPQIVRSKGDSGVANKGSIFDSFPKGRSSGDPSRLPTPDASGPSPFHPDQMDPISAVENRKDQNNEVKWYYSNYNSDNINPYISPSRANTARDSSSSSFIKPSFNQFTLLSVFTVLHFFLTQ